MAYSQGSKILDTDYNTFVNDVIEVFGDSNSGGTVEASANFGYGQSHTLATKSNGDKVTAADWTDLLVALHKCADHQGTTVTSPTSVAVGSKVSVLTSLVTDISNVRTNRLILDVGEGTLNTEDSTDRVTTWDTTITQTVTATFASWDAIRYFFNSGSEIRFSGSLANGAPNTTEANWQAMFTAMQKVKFDHTKCLSTGGVGTTSGLGFYNLTASDQQVFSYIPPGYATEEYKIEARLNGAPGSATAIIFTISFVTPAGGDTISGTLNSLTEEFRATGANVSVTSPTTTSSAIA